MIRHHRPGDGVRDALRCEPIELKQQAVAQVTGPHAGRSGFPENPDDPLHGGHVRVGHRGKIRRLLGQVAAVVQARHDRRRDSAVPISDHKPQVMHHGLGP